MSMMNLYMWRSEYLKQYSSGFIIVKAENPEKAREHARKHFRTYDTERYSWDYRDNGQALDEDSYVDIQERRELFERDLDLEPVILEHGIFIPGSE